MHRNGRRPIRKCGKCKLNLKTHCGLFDDPHDAWNRHRKCPGYMSEEHYQEYLRIQERLEQERHSKPSVFARREGAKLRHTEPHYDGRRPTKPRVRG